MKTYAKYISKHLTSFLFFVIFLFLFNIISFVFTFYGIITKDYGENAPNKLLPIIAENCSIDGISSEINDRLQNHKIWAMFLTPSGEIQWEIDLPAELPDTFTLQDVARFSKGYLYDYPVFTWTTDDGLLVLGYPKGSYAKLTGNYFSENAIRMIPFYFLGMLIVNFILIFGCYFWSKKRIVKNTAPILSSITSLANGKTTSVNVAGELSEIAESINNASYILSKQNEARANWISGVSHDIRTPLSMIMGYADRIAHDDFVSQNIKEQADIIRKQSIQIKELIADLNLVSKLEYDMQPLEIKQIRAAKLLRNYVADLLNSGVDDRYSIDIIISSSAETLLLSCDTRLITRAINNLVQNSIKHNADGCSIALELDCTTSYMQLLVKDDGIGISLEKKKELEKPHYMECYDERLDLRHGLGLLLVRRIVEAHNGSMEILNMTSGYATLLRIPTI